MSMLNKLFLHYLAEVENLNVETLLAIYEQWEEGIAPLVENKIKSIPIKKRKTTTPAQSPSKKMSVSTTSLASEMNDEIALYKASLVKMTCPQLKALIKSHNLSCPKTKEAMINLLLKTNAKLQQGPACFYLDPALNKHVHSETGLVIDSESWLIVGKKLPIGDVIKLGPVEIDVCRENNFKWDPMFVDADNGSFEQEKDAPIAPETFDDETDIEDSSDDLAE